MTELREDIIIKDLHFHSGYDAGPDDDADSIVASLSGVEKAVKTACMVSLSAHEGCENGIVQNPLHLLIKATYPHLYAYASLEYLHRDITDAIYSPECQAERLLDIGFDGIKMLESKPTSRKAIGIRADDSIYQGFFSLMERRGLPIVWHVGDPAEFWDFDTTPAWARDHGYGYWDGSYVPQAELYGEVENVMSAFPKLRVVFAHFFFLSGDLKRAGKILDRWENAGIDLTPGCEMYFNFSAHPDESRAFFTKYSTRICFGTDNMAMTDCCASVEAAKVNTNRIRRFLETSDVFESWDNHNIKGLALEDSILENIYHRNFERLNPEPPKSIDIPKAISYIEDELSLIRARSGKEYYTEKLVRQCLDGLRVKLSLEHASTL